MVSRGGKFSVSVFSRSPQNQSIPGLTCSDLDKAAGLLGARLLFADVAMRDGTPRHDPARLAGVYAQIFEGE